MSTQDRRTRLLDILRVEAPTLDLRQIGDLLTDLIRQTQAEERDRMRPHLQAARNRLHVNKGRGWQNALDDVEKEIEWGHQRLFT